MRELRKKAAACIVIALFSLLATVIVLIEYRYLSYPLLAIVGGFTSVGSYYLVQAKKAANDSNCSGKNN